MKEQQHLSRRHLFRGAAGTAIAASLLGSKSVHGWNEDHEECSVDSAFFGPKPIPGGGAPFKPLGIFVHHNPLNPALALADISDPSQITDFDGFVGLTNIHGQGTGTDAAGMQTQLAFRADMGFSKGKFIGTDGRLHKATLAFV